MGQVVPFERWYRPAGLPELTVLFITPLDRDLALLWGLSTGERGEKYRVHPGLYVGLTVQVPLRRNIWLTASATTVLFGNARERSCLANYGAIGGWQEVNCRLAASPLPPAETLRYLIRTPGYVDTAVNISLTIAF